MTTQQQIALASGMAPGLIILAIELWRKPPPPRPLALPTTPADNVQGSGSK